MPATPIDLVIITGLSGSGKSVALNVLEDAGYYCVDNIPGRLFNTLVDTLIAAGHPRAALTMDARSGDDMSGFVARLESLRERGIVCKVIYLDARDDTLVRRFSETRRRHPLYDGERTLQECIARDRELLTQAAEAAGHIDTSELSANALRGWVRDFVQAPRAGLTLLFESFGFKDGIPIDADFVFDVRCLPNPHWQPELRPFTGRDPQVAAFLEQHAPVQQMFDDLRGLLERWLPGFQAERRSYMTIAVGCTGGQHRSVYLVERLAAHFAGQGIKTQIRHRELA